MKKIIPIALACDTAYFDPMIVTITSLLMNKKDQTFYHVFILKDSFTNDETQKLKYFETTYPQQCTVECQVVTDTTFDFVEKKGRLSSPNFYRFSMIESIQEYDTIIWCDTDIIILNDLTEFYELITPNKYFVGVDMFTYNPERANKLKDYKITFNAGFIVMNLKKMRETNFIEQLCNWYKSEKAYNTTQQVLWDICTTDDVVLAPYKYNVITTGLYFRFHTNLYLNPSYRYEIGMSEETYKEIRDGIDNPIVIHYTSGKPWKVFSDYDTNKIASYVDVWWHYYKLSHIYNLEFYLDYQYTMNTTIQQQMDTLQKSSYITKLIKEAIKHPITFIKKIIKKCYRLLFKRN